MRSPESRACRAARSAVAAGPNAVFLGSLVLTASLTSLWILSGPGPIAVRRLDGHAVDSSQPKPVLITAPGRVAHLKAVQDFGSEEYTLPEADALFSDRAGQSENPLRGRPLTHQQFPHLWGSHDPGGVLSELAGGFEDQALIDRSEVGGAEAPSGWWAPPGAGGKRSEGKDLGEVLSGLGEIGDPQGELDGVQKFDKWAAANPDEGWRQCASRPSGWPAPDPGGSEERYIVWKLDGGLSQQAWEVTNSILVARILNATYVVPDLFYDPYWQDDSSFGSVFDLNHFRSSLFGDVRVLLQSELPPHLQDSKNWLGLWPPQAPAYPSNYTDLVLPQFKKYPVVQMWGLNILADYLPDVELEKMRCRVRFQSLRLAHHIEVLGDTILTRLRVWSRNGKFLALHLRFEEDMIAYSGCAFLGTDEERARFAAMRKKREWPEHSKTPLERRRDGECPPSPGEVAKWLYAMGYGPDTLIYLASGKLYEEQRAMAPFRRLFPKIVRKGDVLSKEEMDSVAGKNNILAALDGHVLLNADVSASTFHSLMRNSIDGQRRWRGHKLTVQYPNWNMQKAENFTWPDYVKAVRDWTPVGKPMNRYSIYNAVLSNPVPDCMCQVDVSSLDRKGL